MSTIKRITYLERRSDLPPADFRRHWSTVHAEIATGLPSVVSYRQNHVTRIVAPPVDGDAYAVDGIVELWFGDGDAFDAGYRSDVADRLAADEPNFLQGLTGAAVHSGGPTPRVAAKVWVLGRGEHVDDLDSLAARIASAAPAVFTQTNRVDASRPPLLRERLRSDPEPPQVSVSVGFSTPEEAASSAHVIAGIVADSSLRRVQVVTAEEITVIPAPSPSTR